MSDAFGVAHPGRETQTNYAQRRLGKQCVLSALIKVDVRHESSLALA